MALPPVFAASALYDNLLQAALRQFFDRATFETEPIPSLSSDGRLAIEPTGDPSVLSVRWFGIAPRVARAGAASVHLTRGATGARHRRGARRCAIARSSIPSRCSSAATCSAARSRTATSGRFSSEGRTPIHEQKRADLVAERIEVLRVAALSSYENRAISSGVLLLDGQVDPARMRHADDAQAYRYTQALTGVKSFFRLCDGIQTQFLVNGDGLVLDIVDLSRWSRESGAAARWVTCPAPYRSHAQATAGNRNISVVLSPNHEIKVFAEGVQMFSFSNARWHLLDIDAKHQLWANAVGNPLLAERLLQTALDLADARQGALFVVLRDPPASLPLLVAPADQLDSVLSTSSTGAAPNRTQMMYMLRGQTAMAIDPAVLAGLARIDGAAVMDTSGRILAIGAILLHPEPVEPHSTLAVEGARTTAAMAAGRYGPVLKVSEDGLITFYDRQERIWDI